MSVVFAGAGTKDEEVRRQEGCHRDAGGQDGCQGDLLQHPPAAAVLQLCRGGAEESLKVF